MYEILIETSSNINEVIRAVSNPLLFIFLRKDFAHQKHKNATKQKHKNANKPIKIKNVLKNI